MAAAGLPLKSVRIGVLIAFLSMGALAQTKDYRLISAAKKQDVSAVERLLKQVDVNIKMDDGVTALHWAAHWSDLQTLRRLIQAKADVNAPTDLGITPIWLACENGNDAAVEELLRAGAAPNTVAATGVSALMGCVRTGSAEAVQSLLTRGADPNNKEKSKGQTALMWAAARGHFTIARMLIDHGA